jgi:MSHA biogenesis protein MshQ
MTLPSSGPLSLQDINAEFGRGTNLNAYRGTSYYLPTSVTQYFFPSGTISISNFYGTQLSSPVTPGTATFATAGTFYWTPPALYNTMTVEIWGGGGSGGSSYSGGSTGGGGQGGYYTAWSIPQGALSTSEQIVIGAGGAGGNYKANPGSYSVFGQYAWSQGGYGGYGALYSQQPSSTYTPSSSRSFTLTSFETGGDGGLQGSQSSTYTGASTTYAGAGGAAMMNDPANHGGPYVTYGGTSTVGGGNGGGQWIGQYCNPGTQPGGGGAAYFGGSPASGAAGKIVITWT